MGLTIVVLRWGTAKLAGRCNLNPQHRIRPGDPIALTVNHLWACTMCAPKQDRNTQ